MVMMTMAVGWLFLTLLAPRQAAPIDDESSAAGCAHRPPRHTPAAGAADAFRTGAFSAGLPPAGVVRSPRAAAAVSSLDAAVRPGGGGESSPTAEEPLRILIRYDENFHTGDSNAAELRRLLQDAVAYWQATLTVRLGGAAAAFWLPRACNSNQVVFVRSPVSGAFLHYCKDGCSPVTYCGHTPVPESHLDLCRELTNNGTSLGHSTTRGLGIRRPYNYALYVSAYPTVRCGGRDSQTLAYSAHCQLDGVTDRPLAGYINLCPGRLSGHFAMRAEAQYTARHELLHALGLTATLFAFMRRDDWTPRTPRNLATNLPALGMLDGGDTGIFQWSRDTVVEVIEPWRSVRGLYNLTRHYLVTPRVVPRVRAHYNCPSLPGLPLENQGQIGSALTHWEKRLLESELMTAAYTGSSIVSEFTLAFLEDTGWYRANYSMAEPLAWGRGLGCQFATGSCYDWMRRQGPGITAAPYCAEVPRYANGQASMLRTGCSQPDLLAKQYCNLDEHKRDLPPEYQYFSQAEPATLFGQLTALSPQTWSRYGGTSRFADYCPYPQAYTTFAAAAAASAAAVSTAAGGSGTSTMADRTSECRQALNQSPELENPTLEVYGPDSLCLGQTEPFRLRFCDRLLSVTSYGSGCYRVRCSPELGRPLVSLGGAGSGVEFACPLAGGRVEFSLAGNYSLYYGSLLCPPCERLCGTGACGGVAAAKSPLLPPPPRLPGSVNEPCTPELKSLVTAGSAPVSSLLLIAMLLILLLFGGRVGLDEF